MLPVSVATLILALATPAGAAPPPITWGSATNISGDSDVSTSGTLMYAYNIGGAGVSSATVNTVTFASYAFPAFGANTASVTVGNLTFSESPGRLWGNNSLGTGSGTYSTLSAGYQSLLGSGGGSDNPATITVTLGGLTIGTQYQLQVWSSNPSNGNLPGTFLAIQDTILSTSLSNQVTLDINVGNSAGSLGQYVLGTFTAVGTSQAFKIDSVGYASPLISAIQLRDLTPIPGPGGAALAAIIGAMLPAGRRRR
ncbi:MAG: hypothetical protein ACKOHI_02360 [Phycisphaerales bacterium]